MHDHADTVADEDDIAVLIENGRGGRVIGRQAHQRVAALGSGDVANGLAPNLGLF